MKKLTSLFLLFCCLFLFTSCGDMNSSNYEKPEQPHLYWKDIDVVVTEIDKRYWFATTHWYTVNITVYNEEYNLTQTFEDESSGLFVPNSWNYEKGDVIKAQLYSWKMDSTGEIVKRQINKIY